MPRRAFAVVDLGFGDAGKGLITDYLVRRTGATAVVRFNGGAQAGHNVVTDDGRHHTFAQLGSGTFVPGVRTLLSRQLVIDPAALLVEERRLREAGVADAFARLSIHDQALVATPFHRAVNCAREERRGVARHGSCGVGFGETVQDALADPEGALRAGDLGDSSVLRRKLARIAERKVAELRGLGASEAAAELAHPEVLDRVEAAFAVVGRLGLVVDEAGFAAALRAADTLVLEGAQGVLLCERHGFPPHTTWSRCDLHNLAALPLDRPVMRIGVLRAVAVRHGPGPFPTEVADLGAEIAEPHNRTNPWQGPVRYGWFDAVLGRYAVAAVGGVDALAVTHLDTLERLPQAWLCDGYQIDQQRIRELPRLADEPQREQWGARLWVVSPRLEPFRLGALGELLGCAVALEARGPTASAVRAVGRLPDA